MDETSSLLPKPHDDAEQPESPQIGDVYNLGDERKSRTRLIWNEFKILSKGSIPVIVAYALQNSLQTISVVIVGRGSPEDLATAAFSYMFAMSTAWLIALGGSTALDTLCSSSFTGSRDPHDLGILLQRSFLILGLFYIPVIILWGFSEPVFIALGQGEQLSHDSARFLWCLIPGGLGYIYFECMKKFLQAQGRSFNQIRGNYMLIRDRDHETRNLCFDHYITNKRGSKFPLRVYIQHGSAGSSGCHGYLLLAFILAAASIRSLCQRLGLMGWVVPEMPLQYGNIRTPRRSWGHSCGHGMVGF